MQLNFHHVRYNPTLKINFTRMKRDIIKIDEALCNGCGLCVPNCHEGALQVIDEKVRLVSELMCDGLGACIGHCPEGAITIEKREAEPYSETRVIEAMLRQGRNTIVAHLMHLKDHGEKELIREAIAFLKDHARELSFDPDEVIAEVHHHAGCGHHEHHEHHGHHGSMHAGHRETAVKSGCPGSKEMALEPRESSHENGHPTVIDSALSHWPVQLHLVNPNSAFFRDADLLLAADCVAYTIGNFHGKFLSGKSLAIACPKLDSGTDIYIEKLAAMIDSGGIKTITVMMMEVPCCSGLLHLVRKALASSRRKVPVKEIIVGINGTIIKVTGD
jgi:ferredoxin